ncbi:glycosyltransferase family A protein [Croceibacterium ferulae]|uniref:glycosyltransferase family 2 protein n=1 Tax=Croceibacterium ferulae TaxID=1854641 RepID=UPI000EABE29F
MNLSASCRCPIRTFTSADDLVSVIVPAYNAENTIEETLLSIRTQSHRNLEIIVVDDGSRDRTLDVAQQQAAFDPRIRVVSQPNGGVAAARNLGIDLARGNLVAPVDADDLWRPRKLERQLRALYAAGPQAGLVYCWSAIIDERSIITARASNPSYTGDVLPQLFYGNFVGNGSSALMRKEVVNAVGGYDSSLRAREAQGCEDWKLYLLIAERSNFAAVSDHLVGYRFSNAAMSGDVSQMLRSDAIVREEMAGRHPDSRFELEWGRRHYLEWLLWRELNAQNWKNCSILVNESSVTASSIRTGTRRLKLGLKFLRKKLRKDPASLVGVPFKQDGPTVAVT